MIKYIIEKTLQVFAIIVLPICAISAYDDGSWFCAFVVVLALIPYLLELGNRNLEKKLHGEL